MSLSPFYCSMLVHGVKDKPAESGVAFLQWKERVFTQAICWASDVDREGFPRFHIVTLAYVQQPDGFLQQAWQETLTACGLDPLRAGPVDVRYVTWQQLFVNEIGAEEPEHVAG